MIARSTQGRTTVGASWQVMGSGVLYLIPVTIPADHLLGNIAAHLRNSVANVHSIAGYVYADAAGAPGDVLGFSGQVTGSSLLGTSTGRWVHFSVGLWFAVETDVWVGVSRSVAGANSWDMAFDATGGSGGSRASTSDAAAWTPGTNDWSIYGELFS